MVAEDHSSKVTTRLLRWLSGKGAAGQRRRYRFHPWVRNIPWRRKWKPTPVILPEKSPREDPTCCGASEPVRDNYWASAPEPGSQNCWARVPQLLPLYVLQYFISSKVLRISSLNIYCESIFSELWTKCGQERSQIIMKGNRYCELTIKSQFIKWYDKRNTKSDLRRGIRHNMGRW